MNAVVCGVLVSRYIMVDEEDVTKDFSTLWDELHLSRNGIQSARRGVEE